MQVVGSFWLGHARSLPNVFGISSYWRSSSPRSIDTNWSHVVLLLLVYIVVCNGCRSLFVWLVVCECVAQWTVSANWDARDRNGRVGPQRFQPTHTQGTQRYRGRRTHTRTTTTTLGDRERSTIHTTQCHDTVNDAGYDFVKVSLNSSLASESLVEWMWSIPSPTHVMTHEIEDIKQWISPSSPPP